jgi:pimeloyl-ACP methyl ester carboxylesterase
MRLAPNRRHTSARRHTLSRSHTPARRPTVSRWLAPARLAALTTAAFAVIAPAGASAAALGTNGAAAPVLAWGACDPALLEASPEFTCATASVPLDYRKPTGAKIQLAVSKLPATGPGSRLGTVFVNPGGPGAPGLDSPTFATSRLRERFDIVGFDPRGTGASTPPVRCATTSEEAASLLNPTFPLNPIQEATAANKAAQGAAGCRASATIAARMSTANVARDLDLLRRAVGDAKLSFLGFSSGTLIGETYANLFPATTRALALDGTIDPQRFTAGRSLVEASQPLDERLKSYVGTDEAVTGFLTACAAAPGTCAFASPSATTATQLRTKFRALLARIRANNGVTVDLGDGPTTLSYQDVIGMIYGELNVGIFTSQDLAGTLDALDAASQSQTTPIPSHDLRALIDTLRRWLHRPSGPAVEPYDNFQDAFSTFICNDTVGPTSSSPYVAYGRSSDQAVPGFGPFWIWTTAACASFPVQDPDVYRGPWNAKTTAPILVLGNRGGDPSVRYTNAVLAQSTLGKARLLSVDMYGHTSYNLASSCVDDAVDGYLIGLALPPAGASCGTDFGPFDPVSEAASDAGAADGYRRGFTRH